MHLKLMSKLGGGQKPARIQQIQMQHMQAALLETARASRRSRRRNRGPSC